MGINKLAEKTTNKTNQKNDFETNGSNVKIKTKTMHKFDLSFSDQAKYRNICNPYSNIVLVISTTYKFPIMYAEIA